MFPHFRRSILNRKSNHSTFIRSIFNNITNNNENENSDRLQRLKKIRKSPSSTPSSLSWKDSIDNAKKLSEYDMNLIQRMITDHTLNNIMDYKGLESKASFQESIRFVLTFVLFELFKIILVIYFCQIGIFYEHTTIK